METVARKPWRFSRKRRLLIWSRGLGERVQYLWRPRPSPAEALLLVGPGRSGTTWLSQILTACGATQLIFEPLNPVWSPEVARLTGWSREQYTPRLFYLPATAVAPEWHDYLQRLLTGRVRSAGTDYERTSYFPRRYLIKLIRANLMLGYIWHHFRPRLLYIERHPCATVVSRLKSGWQPDTADLLAQKQLVADHLAPWEDDIEREQSAVGAGAVVWAVESIVARRTLAAVPHYAVSYEALLVQPEQQVRQILAWAGLPAPNDLAERIAQPSRQSRREARYASTLERLAAWQKTLSTAEQQRILEWAHRLGNTRYGADVLPLELHDQGQIRNLSATID